MKWKEWSSVAEDESRWVSHHERGLVKAEHLHDYVLRLWFRNETNVSIYDLDFQPLFVEDNPGGVFTPLKELEHFKHVHGDYALIWVDPQSGKYDENAVDIAPECVRFFCEKYGKLQESSTLENAAELIH
jgi:hypothetical protein